MAKAIQFRRFTDDKPVNIGLIVSGICNNNTKWLYQCDRPLRPRLLVIKLISAIDRGNYKLTDDGLFNVMCEKLSKFIWDYDVRTSLVNAIISALTAKYYVVIVENN